MLFDKNEYPDFEGLDAESAWQAVEDYEDYVYNIADSLSEEKWDCMIQSVRDLYSDYYRKYER